MTLPVMNHLTFCTSNLSLLYSEQLCLDRATELFHLKPMTKLPYYTLLKIT